MSNADRELEMRMAVLESPVPGDHDGDGGRSASGAKGDVAPANGARRIGCPWEFDHGEHCDCVILAAAVGLGPEAISCYYCRDVLQKHWRIRCRHGEHGSVEMKKVSERWRNVGEIDPLKAILIKEG